MEAHQLRQEAEATDRLAAVVSYRPDKEWLAAKARQLRHEADRLEQLERRRGDLDGEAHG